LEKMRLRWSAFSSLLADLGYGKIIRYFVGVFNVVFSFFANLNPYFCSRVWCFWVGGFEEIEYRFRAVK